MSDLLQDTREAIGLFDGSLTLGNHDSITLLGAQAQAALRDYSRSASKLLLRKDDELESAINDVISEIERFDVQAVKKVPMFFEFVIRKKSLAKEYHKLVAYMERACLFFQMQQAQLLKETKLLEKLSATVGESAVSLKHCIEIGERVLENRNSEKERSDPDFALDLSDRRKEIDAWYARLVRRIDDLRVSYTAALQNQAQINFLCQNNLVLLDRISAIITNTFPIWQSQMVVILGTERLKKRLEDQDNVFRRSLGNTQQLDLKRVEALNEQLKAALQETVSLRKNDLRIRKEFQENIYH